MKKNPPQRIPTVITYREISVILYVFYYPQYDNTVNLNSPITHFYSTVAAAVSYNEQNVYLYPHFDFSITCTALKW